MRISKWWECTAILYSRFNWENAHFITLLSHSKQNTYGTWWSIWKITKSILIQTWTDTKVLLGNITTELNIQLAWWHQTQRIQQLNIIYTFTNIMLLTMQMHIVPFKCQMEILYDIPLYESSCHDPRQRLQNLGHARSENSQILECAAKIIYIKIWKKIKMKILQICIPFSIHYLANFRLTGV